MTLTAKQSRFVEEYLVDLNATQAAIRAGYSEKTAKNIGYEQLQKPEVVEAISAAQVARSERTRIDADWVLRRLADAVDADLADIYDEHQNLRPIGDWPAIWRKGLISGVEVEELFEGRGEDREHIGRLRKVKQADRTKLLELLGKHVEVQAFKEKVEHEGAIALTPSITINGKPG
jgi:phage terminase small subunit